MTNEGLAGDNKVFNSTIKRLTLDYPADNKAFNRGRSSGQAEPIESRLQRPMADANLRSATAVLLAGCKSRCRIGRRTGQKHACPKRPECQLGAPRMYDRSWPERVSPEVAAS